MADIIQTNTVVSFHYTLKDKEGAVLDQSTDEPLAYLHGHNNIIPGLEKALTGLKVGDKKQVVVPPDQGYGSYEDDKVFALERQSLPPGDIQAGMVLELHPDDGEPFLARITEVTSEAVTVDANHPMAGKELFFDVEVAQIRAASADEVAHGHAHGPGGHHHHH